MEPHPINYISLIIAKRCKGYKELHLAVSCSIYSIRVSRNKRTKNQFFSWNTNAHHENRDKQHTGCFKTSIIIKIVDSM